MKATNRTRTKRRKRADLIQHISYLEKPVGITSVTLAARSTLGPRPLSVLADQVSRAYAFSSWSRRLRCVRAYVGLPDNAIGVLTFFEGTRLLSTAPTEQQAQELLRSCSCAAAVDGRVCNVFARGILAETTLDLEALKRSLSWPCRFDGPRARSVLRVQMEQVQLDAYATGLLTLKGRSEEAIEKAYRQFLDFFRDFSPQRP